MTRRPEPAIEPLTISLPEAVKLTGYGRATLLCAYHAEEIDGHAQVTPCGRVHAYKLNRASLVAWLRNQDRLAAQRRRTA